MKEWINKWTKTYNNNYVFASAVESDSIKNLWSVSILVSKVLPKNWYCDNLTVQYLPKFDSMKIIQYVFDRP